jgi:hypothetical protein
VLALALGVLALFAEGSFAPYPMSKVEAEKFCRDNPSTTPKYPLCVAMAQMTSQQQTLFMAELRKTLWIDAADWAPQIVKIGTGWSIAAGTSDVVLLTNSGGGPPQSPRLWMRGEYRVPQASAVQSIRSLLQLIEFDCASDRARTLQISTWTMQNMEGDRLDVPASAAWSYPLPDSVTHSMMARACKRSPPAQ